MNRVSVRQFQLKASLYLPRMPIVLTVHKRDVAILSPIPAKGIKGEKIMKIPKLSGLIKEESLMPRPHAPTPPLVAGVDYIDVPIVNHHVNAGTPPPAPSLGLTPKEPRPSAQSTIVYCPHCNAPCWREFANKHYMENHEV